VPRRDIACTDSPSSTSPSEPTSHDLPCSDWNPAKGTGRRRGNVADELEQLFRRIAFTILISNTEDHLRNHAFLHVHADILELSPAFDLNANPQTGPRHLSTAIDGDTLADIDQLLKYRRALPPLPRPGARGRAAGPRRRHRLARCRRQERHRPSACDAMSPAFDNPAARRTTDLLT